MTRPLMQGSGAYMHKADCVQAHSRMCGDSSGCCQLT